MSNSTCEANGATANVLVSRITKRLTDRHVWSIVIRALVCLYIGYCIAWSSLLGGFLAASNFDIDFLVRIIIFVGVLCSELARIWRGEYSKQDACALLLLALASSGFLYLGQYGFLYDTLLVFAARNEDFRELIKLCGITLAVCMTAVFLCVALGLIDDIVVAQGSRNRHFLGFIYCLYPPQLMLSIAFIVCWLRGRSITWLEIIALAICIITLFVITDSRASFGLGVVMIAFAVAYKLSKTDRALKVLAKVAAWIFVATVLATIVAMLAYHFLAEAGVDWLSALNRLTSSRISLAYDQFLALGVQPFGQHIDWVGSGFDVSGQKIEGAYNYVDNAYVHAAIERGLVYVVVFVALHTAAAFKANKSDDFVMSAILVILAAHFLVDDLSLNLWFNPLLFVMSSYLLYSTKSRFDKEGDCGAP